MPTDGEMESIPGSTSSEVSTGLGMSLAPASPRALRVLFTLESQLYDRARQLLAQTQWDAEPYYTTDSGELPEGHFDIAFVDADVLPELSGGFFEALRAQLGKRVVFLSDSPVDLSWLAQKTGYDEETTSKRTIVGRISAKTLVATIRRVLRGRTCIPLLADGREEQGDQRRLRPGKTRGRPFRRSDIVGKSLKIREVLDLVSRVAPTDATVLVLGESGTGKELVARALHCGSARASGPFLAVSCGRFTESLLESALFGHVKGAFTGATSDKKGMIEAASGGTLLLDEVAEMSPATQVSLLRVIEDCQVTPVGGVKPKAVDVRFIAATNADLEALVHSRRFRDDLYYRLNVMSITLPPLRERKEDIPLLAGRFLTFVSRKCGRDVRRISEEVMADLTSYDWPGNVRELENLVERAVILCSGITIEPENMPLSVRNARTHVGNGVGEDDDRLGPDYRRTFDAAFATYPAATAVRERRKQVKEHLDIYEAKLRGSGLRPRILTRWILDRTNVSEATAWRALRESDWRTNNLGRGAVFEKETEEEETP